MSLTAAQAIAERLAREGCKHAIGMPGGEVLLLLDALKQAGIDFTLCKHENAGGFMAEGTWHATGAPGILLTTIGPGLANAVNSIANAFQEQVPLIILSGCIDPAEAEGFTHQVIDQAALLAPITKARFRVAAGTAASVIDKAVAIAIADPPGPVHVDVPYILADQPAGSRYTSAVVRERADWPDGRSLEKAVGMLDRARRPVLIAGVGAVHHRAGAEIKSLCDKASMPMLTTYKAKGIVPEDDPLCLGGHGLSPLSDRSVLPLLKEADCVVLAGYDPIEMRSAWRNPWDPEAAIEIVHAQCQHGMHGSAVHFAGNISTSLKALETRIERKGPVWPDGEPKRVRDELSKAFGVRDTWGPHQVFDTLQRLLPDNAVVTVDSGAHRILLSQMWRCKGPGALLQSSAFCTMGVSVPLAAGFLRAEPERTVVAVVGDAGLEMVIGELATLRDHDLNVVIVVLVDRSLALIDLKQTRSQLPSLGVSFGQTDLVAIAAAYGGYAAWVDDADTFEAKFLSACRTSQFGLLACRIDKEHYNEAF